MFRSKLVTCGAALALVGAAQMASALTYEQTILADNPVVYLPFNEAAGGTASNAGSLGAAGNGAYNNVTLGGQAILPQLGTAAQFNGANSNVRITDNAAFDVGSGPFSVELWYNTTTAARGDLFTYKGGGGDYGIHSNSENGNSASSYFNGFNGQALTATNQWHHLVATRAADGTYNVYRNGVLASTNNDLDTWNIANDILIGANHDGNPSNPLIPFAGRIDEVAIYNTALSAGSVTAHYTAAFQDAAKGLSVNFASGAGNEGPFNVVSHAGVVPMLNWNNATTNTGAAVPLVDSDGNPIATVLNFSSPNAWTNGTWPDDGSNGSMMRGYLDTEGTGGAGIDISLGALPAEYADGYDVIVYFDGDGTGRFGEYTVDDGAKSLTLIGNDDGNNIGGFVQDMGLQGDSGNYLVFSDFHGLNLRITSDAFTPVGGADGFRAPINGIQLVRAAAAVPEPASALLGLAGLAVLGMRRRRAA